MIEPVALENFVITFFASAMVIVMGALYALLFAYARVHRVPRLMPFAYLSYAGLVGAVAVIGWTMHLSGFWAAVVSVMLIGYLLAPHGIWHLCEGTHRHAADGNDDAEHEHLMRSSP
ncbi:MAG: hypothetical protein KDG50_11425 [Chromatiales bacterium]|nr:hypothetical protein [Chromatiales bacterium]